jgi:DMSO/TMAO reductase YedYZ molybdopterin-dependent catalytic subunit
MPNKSMPNKLTPEQEMSRRTRRGFMALGAGALVAAGGWQWLNAGYARGGDIPGPLRSVLQFNERVVRKALFSDEHLVKTYPASAIGKLKENGQEGLSHDFDADDWGLQVMPRGGGLPASLHMDDIRALPQYEQTFDFKCVEGWSVVTQFAGARFSDFAAKFAPGSEQARFVGMATPDGGYYVGLDMPSALHPQTLLAYKMNGEDLADEHGAPLRLVIPVKYGIKNIKRIGRIVFGETEPPDYWRERGYDFYAGL